MAIKKNDIKLKGHESFYIREGWITKGLKAVVADENIFSKREATDELGVGTGMVKAIKYWLLALGLIEKDKTKKIGFTLTKFGMKIYENDLYIEDRFTLWILHYKLVSNFKLATVWNIYVNRFYVKEFTKEELVDFINEELITEVGKENFSSKSVNDDCTCIIKTYLRDNNQGTPEENFKCPLAELGLIERKKDRHGKDIFIRTKPNKKKYNNQALFYVIQEGSNKGQTTIENIIENENSLAKVFNLDRNDINELLDELEKEGLITVNRTAGLNTIYLEEKDIITDYYNNKGR